MSAWDNKRADALLFTAVPEYEYDEQSEYAEQPDQSEYAEHTVDYTEVDDDPVESTEVDGDNDPDKSTEVDEYKYGAGDNSAYIHAVVNGSCDYPNESDKYLVGGIKGGAEVLEYDVPDQTLDGGTTGAGPKTSHLLLDSDSAESLAVEHNKHKDEILLGLEITEQCIRDNDLIITGGMAINAALMLKGYVLYGPHIQPDWDFYSDKFHIHAFNIANDIAKRTNQNTVIEVIGAMHPSTMRTRVYYTPVADSSYLPTELYNRIPTLTHDGIRAVHPHWQMIDQLMSLSRPYSNRPYETISHRWVKDTKRFHMLSKLYPVNAKGVKGPSVSAIPVAPTGMIAGLSAVIWYGEQTKLLTAAERAILASWENVERVIFSVNYLTVKGGKAAAKKNPTVTYYNEFLDKLPRCVVTSNSVADTVVYDSKAMQISTVDGHCSLQAVMLQLLTNFTMKGDLGGRVSKVPTSIYGYAYKLCYRMLTAAYNKKPKAEICLPTTNVQGDENWSLVYILSRQNWRINMNMEEKNQLAKPKNAYFDRKRREVQESKYEFNPENSELYQFDGRVSEKVPVPLTID